MKINLIPMAGAGQRFKDVGYTTPKPFLDTDGLPMVVRAALSLPKADRYIFVCRKNQYNDTEFRATLEKYFDKPIIIEIDYLTEGQAITCLCAKDYIPNEAMLTIGAADNDMLYNETIADEWNNDASVDGWIWTFRNNPSVLQDPAMYGWVKIDENDTAQAVACKQPISSNPLNDHAIIGAFTFKKAKYFFDAVAAMIAQNERINNEFYVDTAVNFAIQNRLNIKVLEVNQYVCWGTPKDYELYQFWLAYFSEKKIK